MFMEEESRGERGAMALVQSALQEGERSLRRGRFQQRELLASPNKSCALMRGSRGRRDSAELSRADPNLPPHLSQIPDWPLTWGRRGQPVCPEMCPVGRCNPPHTPPC